MESPISPDFYLDSLDYESLLGLRRCFRLAQVPRNHWEDYLLVRIEPAVTLRFLGPDNTMSGSTMVTLRRREDDEASAAARAALEAYLLRHNPTTDPAIVTTDQVLIASRWPRASLFTTDQWPIPVEVSLWLIDPSEPLPVVRRMDLFVIGWGELYQTEAQARESGATT